MAILVAVARLIPFPPFLTIADPDPRWRSGKAARAYLSSYRLFGPAPPSSPPTDTIALLHGQGFSDCPSSILCLSKNLVLCFEKVNINELHDYMHLIFGETPQHKL